MEEGKNEIMELRQMIEGCFERQNKLIARLEMELEALSNFNGKFPAEPRGPARPVGTGRHRRHQPLAHPPGEHTAFLQAPRPFPAAEGHIQENIPDDHL